MPDTLDRWPDVASEVRSAVLPSVAKAISTQKTLRINNRQLTSGFNRTGEAEQQARTIPKDATEAWVYGHGLGDCVVQLLMRGHIQGDDRAHLNTVNVVVMSRGITRAVTEFDECGWLKHPRVKLHLARDVEFRRPFCVSPIEVAQCDEDAETLRARIMTVLNVDFNEANLNARRGAEIAQYEENKHAIERDGFVPVLYGTDMRPAFVVGGGPTLAECFDALRAGVGYYNIVASSTALKPLLAAGVVPDTVVVIDPSPDVWKHFDGLPLETMTSTRLVYIPSVFPRVVAEWKGKRHCAQVYVNHPGDLFSGGSVVHAAMDLAVKMGAREVTFCGMDFCYPGERSHVDGAANPYEVAGKSQAWREKTTNGLGERVTTSSEMMQYKVATEDFVAAHPHVAFCKLGRAGVSIAGAKWRDD